MNFYSLHYDKEFWKDPQVFRPERHLDSNGKLIKTDYYFPFGGGKYKISKQNTREEEIEIYYCYL